MRQPKENVTAIELLRFVDNEHVPIYTLENEQFSGFIESVCTFVVSNVRGYPTDNCGLLAVRIYYSNGDIEMFGNEAFKYTTAEGKTDLDDWHSVRYADLYGLFAQYVEMPGLIKRTSGGLLHGTGEGMNIESLKAELKKLQVPERWYSINGSLQSDRYFLVRNYSRWEYFYFDERGNREGCKVFADEETACEYFLQKMKVELKYWRKRS